jgi:cyclohexyl-isocyanide hydratase
MSVATGYRFGVLVFPDVNVLDFTGPLEVFHNLPTVHLHIVATNTQPLRCDNGLVVTPDTSYNECPQLDLLLVPGGTLLLCFSAPVCSVYAVVLKQVPFFTGDGVGALMQDEATLEFLRRQGQQAKYITSVCTGSLVLAAAGLLDGHTATTHWAFIEVLASLGIKTSTARVEVDRNRITAGGESLIQYSHP